MPKRRIDTADHVFAHLRIKSEAQAIAYQEAKVAALQKMEREVEVHEVNEPHTAFVDWSRWIIMCACNAGVAVHSEWVKAYCFGCGAQFTNVVFPEDREEVEAVLLERPHDNRWFFPQKGETLEVLRAENIEHKRELLKVRK